MISQEGILQAISNERENQLPWHNFSKIYSMTECKLNVKGYSVVVVVFLFVCLFVCLSVCWGVCLFVL